MNPFSNGTSQNFYTKKYIFNSITGMKIYDMLCVIIIIHYLWVIIIVWYQEDHKTFTMIS